MRHGNHGGKQPKKAEEGEKAAEKPVLGVKDLWPVIEFIDRGVTKVKDLTSRQEARHRSRQGSGIRVFSRPDHLREWFKAEGLSLESRAHLITDAGQLVPGLTLADDGMEFFVHSPFGHRQNEEVVINRNDNCLVLQATFSVAGTLTRSLMLADIRWDPLDALIGITRSKKRMERLWWDICKLPHHCSAFSLYEEKGEVKTIPTPNIDWLYGQRGEGAILVCSSDPIPFSETPQPPHFQAAKYYQDKLGQVARGQWLVSMEHPSASRPRKIEIEISHHGANAFRESADALNATISIWKLDQRMQVIRIDIPPEPVITQTVGGWVICTDESLLRAASRSRQLQLPNETGGVLLGSYDMQRRILYVVDMLPSPPDSEQWPTSYKRGCRGLARTVDGIRERTLLNLDYVGEWHSHPEGCSVGQSDKDRHALGEISTEMAQKPAYRG